MHSVDAGSMSAAGRSNRGGTGSASVTVLGSGLGHVASTGLGRLGQTGCEGTEWESETSVRCLVEHGGQGSYRVAITTGEAKGSITELCSSDFSWLWLLRNGNSAGTGSSSMTVYGSALGIGGTTGRGRSGQTRCEETEWVSETSLRCMVESANSASLRALVTGGWRSGTMSETFSVDFGCVSALHLRNGPVTGLALVTLYGAGFGQNSLTSSTRNGMTTCEGTRWVSDTAVLCVTSTGNQGSRHVILTSGQDARSASTVLSMDVSMISLVRQANTVEIGNSFLLQGNVLVMSDWSASAGVGHTGCEETVWQSATSLRCRVVLGTGSCHGILVTAGECVKSMSDTYSFDASELTVLQGYNRGATGSASVSVYGVALGLQAFTAGIRAGLSASEGTEWVSETSMKSLHGRGDHAASSLRVVVSLSSRSASISKAFSYDAAVLTGRVGISNAPPTNVVKALYINGRISRHESTSLSSRLGFSQCEASEWISGSTLMCKFVRANPGSVLSVAITAYGIAAGSISDVFTIDVPWISSVKDLYTSGSPKHNGMFVDLLGQNFGVFDATLKVGIGDLILQDRLLGCKSTLWTSDSAISCQIFPKWQPVAKLAEILEVAPGSLVCNTCVPPYVTAKCSVVSTGHCALCQPCDAGKYRFGCVPGGISEGFCRSCQTLPETPMGQRTFKSTVGTPLTQCTPCTICGGANQDGRQFEVSACTDRNDAVCQNCSTCGAGVRVGCAGPYAGFCSTSIGALVATANKPLQNFSLEQADSTLSLIQDVELQLLGENSDIMATFEAGSLFKFATNPSDLVITLSKVTLSSLQEVGLTIIESGLLVLSSPILLAPEDLAFSPELTLRMPVQIVDGMAVDDSATHVAELFWWESSSGLWLQQPGLVVDFNRGMGYAKLQKLGVYIALRVQRKIPVSSAPFKVVFVLGLPISKDEFDTAKQSIFINSIASAAQVHVESVSITSIEVAKRRASGTEVGVAVGAATADSASAIAGNLTPESINSQLVQAGLPSATMLQSPAVQNSAALKPWVPAQTPAKRTDGLGVTFSQTVPIVVFVVLVFGAVIWIARMRWYNRRQSFHHPTQQSQDPVGPLATADAGLELGGRAFNTGAMGMSSLCFPFLPASSPVTDSDDAVAGTETSPGWGKRDPPLVQIPDDEGSQRAEQEAIQRILAAAQKMMSPEDERQAALAPAEKRHLEIQSMLQKAKRDGPHLEIETSMSQPLVYLQPEAFPIGGRPAQFRKELESGGGGERATEAGPAAAALMSVEIDDGAVQVDAGAVEETLGGGIYSHLESGQELPPPNLAPPHPPPRLWEMSHQAAEGSMTAEGDLEVHQAPLSVAVRAGRGEV